MSVAIDDMSDLSRDRLDMDVSVIITSYNQKELLREAVDSVLSQTVDPYEIFIIDANSSDGSQALIQEFESSNPEIVNGILLQEDPGLPQTRNRALEEVSGDYVSILDGDDRFLPHKIESELKKLHLNPDFGAIYSNYYIINRSGGRISLRYSTKQPSGRIFGEVFAGKFGMLRSMLISYNELERIGFLDDEFWHYDGFDMTVETSKNTQIGYVHKPLAEYRRHPGGAAAWRTAADLLPELRGIFEKHHQDIDRFSPDKKQVIESRWEARLAKVEARTARERGDYFHCMRQYLRSALINPSDLLNYKKILKYTLPSPVYNLARRAYWHYHGWSL